MTKIIIICCTLTMITILGILTLRYKNESEFYKDKFYQLEADKDSLFFVIESKSYIIDSLKISNANLKFIAKKNKKEYLEIKERNYEAVNYINSIDGDSIFIAFPNLN